MQPARRAYKVIPVWQARKVYLATPAQLAHKAQLAQMEIQVPPAYRVYPE